MSFTRFTRFFALIIITITYFQTRVSVSSMHLHLSLKLAQYLRLQFVCIFFHSPLLSNSQSHLLSFLSIRSPSFMQNSFNVLLFCLFHSHYFSPPNAFPSIYIYSTLSLSFFHKTTTTATYITHSYLSFILLQSPLSHSLFLQVQFWLFRERFCLPSVGLVWIQCYKFLWRISGKSKFPPKLKQ